MRKGAVAVLYSLLLAPANLTSGTVVLEGQVSGWIAVNEGESARTKVGLRYIPSLSLSKSVSGDYSLDLEI